MIHVLRAELTKTFTLRSIQGALLAAILIPPVLALLSGLSFDPDAPSAAAFPVEAHGFETAGFGQPVIILLAALITGTEYHDGQLRTTLLASPHRGGVLAAKLIVIAGLTTSIGLLATSMAVLLEHAALGERGLKMDEFTADMGWNLLGVAINYLLIALIAASITVLARTLIVTLVVLIPLVLGLTVSLLGMFPALKYLPDLAGLQLLTAYPGVGLLDPVPGGFVMAGWAMLVSGAAWTALRTRDVGQ
ncbi:MAG: ABC transporter permease [Microbacterium sp.]|nr:ABC transporter permease [Microbacterium sp.]